MLRDYAQTAVVPGAVVQRWATYVLAASSLPPIPVSSSALVLTRFDHPKCMHTCMPKSYPIQLLLHAYLNIIKKVTSTFDSP
jgi:hypothetical protein